MRTRRSSTLKAAALLALSVTVLAAAQSDAPPFPVVGDVVLPPVGELDHRPGVVPPDGFWYDNVTYGDLASQWVQWAVAIPPERNPVLDLTGEFCGEGQEGPIWFLAGTFGDVGVVRECTVPRGKAFFFPIVNNFFFNCRDENYTIEEMRDFLAGFANLVCILECTIDGRPVENLESYLATSPLAFGFELPENNILSGGCNPGQAPGGEYAPVIATGYYVLLRPSWFGGRHEIYIHGAACDPVTGEIFFETEVTYDLTVRGW